MPLNWFKCPLCGYERESFKKAPKCNHNQDEEGHPVPLVEMEKQLKAPEAKFMEPRGQEAKDRGRSVLKDQNKILRERTRSWSRDNEMHDLIQKNPKDEAVKNQWVNKDGTARKKIDDI